MGWIIDMRENIFNDFLDIGYKGRVKDKMSLMTMVVTLSLIKLRMILPLSKTL